MEWRGTMAAESLVQMLEEIAVGLRVGDEEIYGRLREQLKECGGSEISVELAMGVIAKLLPEEAQGNLEAAKARPPLGSLIQTVDCRRSSKDAPRDGALLRSASGMLSVKRPCPHRSRFLLC